MQNDDSDEEFLDEPQCLILPWYTISTVYPTHTITFEPSENSSAKKSSKEKRIIIQAKLDAYAFVATNGQYRSAYLERAINQIKKTNVYYADIDIAKAIIAY